MAKVSSLYKALKACVVMVMLGCVLMQPVHADINTELTSFYGKLGFDGNATKAQVWQGQAAGYVTGGSVYLRNPVMNVQLISMQVPSVNSGCGGIDAYLGSFSYISSEQLQRFVKQIMSNAAGYAFDLALQTMVPEMKQAKDFLQKMASDINSMNISSCQAAQGIVGGLWPKTQVSQEKICKDIGSDNNMFSDWAAARQGCTVGGQMDSVNSRASESQKDMVLKNKNLIWETLKKNRMFDGNDQLKEFVMSLTGTIIFSDGKGVQTLPSLADNRDIVRALIQGGTAKVYGCVDKDLCLQTTVPQMTITEDNSLTRLVMKMLISMQSKLSEDLPLTDQEKGFVNTTSVPVLKYLTSSASMGQSATYLIKVSDYIAQDMMIQYLQELVKQASMTLVNNNYPEEASKEMRESINNASRLLAEMKLNSNAEQNALDGLDRNLAYMQQQVSTILLSTYQNNYQFGG
ncbi:putative ATP-binding F pilus assembly protein [Serratia plymuthica A30]|uniref:conjugal transfer pilus assembly protein TraH n=1 Tax=Serratia plymuthica TaxID=82996 RepID=UPI0002A2CD10|nr:putative ATP-binding F pilus assembly protein [Serratia plymuthica A30]